MHFKQILSLWRKRAEVFIIRNLGPDKGPRVNPSVLNTPNSYDLCEVHHHSEDCLLSGENDLHLFFARGGLLATRNLVSDRAMLMVMPTLVRHNLSHQLLETAQ